MLEVPRRDHSSGLFRAVRKESVNAGIHAEEERLCQQRRWPAIGAVSVQRACKQAE
jgi:hypothetical protein